MSDDMVVLSCGCVITANDDGFIYSPCRPECPAIGMTIEMGAEYGIEWEAVEGP